MSRLENVINNSFYQELTSSKTGEVLQRMSVSERNFDWLIEQAEQNKHNHQVLINQERSSDREIDRLRKRVQELEDVIHKDERQAVLEALYEDNQRYKQALEQVWEMTKESIMDGRIYIVVDKALKGESE